MANYIDLNLAFVKHPNTRDILKRYDVDAIKNAIRNLIRTNRGEKPFKPNYGGDLKSLMFEPNVLANKEILRRKWNEMLKMYEPRAIIDRLDVTTENSELYIVLNCSLIEQPNVTFTIPLSVQRIR